MVIGGDGSIDSSLQENSRSCQELFSTVFFVCLFFVFVFFCFVYVNVVLNLQKRCASLLRKTPKGGTLCCRLYTLGDSQKSADLTT